VRNGCQFVRQGVQSVQRDAFLPAATGAVARRKDLCDCLIHRAGLLIRPLQAQVARGRTHSR
jgi:hypothetical protein